MFVGYVLFDGILGAAVSLLPIFSNARRFARIEKEKRQGSFRNAFRDMLSEWHAGLRAGESLEEAFYGAQRAAGMFTESNEELTKGLQRICARMKVNVPLETAFHEFAREHPIEEAGWLAEILLFAKRLGNGYVQVIEDTVVRLRERMDLEEELFVVTAEKRYELKILALMPLLLLAYVRISSPDFLSPLYHNAFGCLLMIGVIAGYLVCIRIGLRITKIEV